MESLELCNNLKYYYIILTTLKGMHLQYTLVSSNFDNLFLKCAKYYYANCISITRNCCLLLILLTVLSTQLFGTGITLSCTGIHFTFQREWYRLCHPTKQKYSQTHIYTHTTNTLIHTRTSKYEQIHIHTRRHAHTRT